MKAHYINILLFALPLNILLKVCHEHNQWNHYMKPHTYTNRSLCECELYAPVNYDSDQQMKKVMDNFNKQTQERFHEYDDRMIEKRKQCKDRCDKEIQKIILKDKLEKELTEKLSTLQTDIQNDAIPTCVCEKSMADKVEKGCLRCGGVLGGGVMPGFGTIGGSLLGALSAWKPKAIAAAIVAAKKAGAAEGAIAGNAQGTKIVTHFLEQWGVKYFCPDLFKSIGNEIPYNDVASYAQLILTKQQEACSVMSTVENNMCSKFNFSFGITDKYGNYTGAPGPGPVKKVLGQLVEQAEKGANAEAANVKSATASKIITEETGVINTIYMGNQTIIIASIVAIVVIVLIMVIIYLILRYRRKKKIKKKLQYIKLLEE
ncbi:rifin [Plasmodium reichenowi]|uniref:Rifin n=1 Tax=Plasmodium reichenowi TaxID=5854 RepID=A0A060RLV0_PLARE|nr:rifin [Plasmodium reichenowi]